MAKRSSFGSMVRRRLSDITNSLPQPKSPENLQPHNASATEFIDHLLKEKMALMKLIQEKNKIIELSGIEIQNLRTCLQKMQLQNWNLAQTNSLMLAEVNSGKQRLKALQHEVVCKDTLLKAKHLQLRGNEELNFHKNVVEEPEELTEESEMNEDTRSCCNGSRRRRLSRSSSLGSSTTSQKRADKETALHQFDPASLCCCRRCLRRQSAASLRSRHDEGTENLFEIDIANHPRMCEDEMEAEARRRSISRPLRKAVGKVQSYKEIPLNIKMRRSQ
ncbi:hypothetical protein C2S53_007393 [Perilla frutescens var. hirtella]|uniref:Shugoshin C-terminal domain-containing protein n=1 Tax=Perilla frutescens var. hirtella TaxID=608512 RepID=A0AAD4JNK3_PERFH|nr:hypothetical protein C2S53_007393 [Perilla frutescens var. hirtella]